MVSDPPNDFRYTRVHRRPCGLASLGHFGVEHDPPQNIQKQTGVGAIIRPTWSSPTHRDRHDGQAQQKTVAATIAKRWRRTCASSAVRKTCPPWWPWTAWCPSAVGERARQVRVYDATAKPSTLSWIYKERSHRPGDQGQTWPPLFTWEMVSRSSTPFVFVLCYDKPYYPLGRTDLKRAHGGYWSLSAAAGHVDFSAVHWRQLV